MELAPNIFRPRNDWNIVVLNSMKYVNSTSPELDVILREICNKEKLPIDILKSNCKVRKVTEARQFYYKRARELTGKTFSEIGKVVNRNHATVLNGIRVVNDIGELKKRYNSYFNS